MGLALLGLAWSLGIAALRISTVRASARRGRPIASPVRYVLRDPNVWVGVVLVAIAVNQVSGEIAVTVALVWGVWFIAKLMVLGFGALRGSPAAIRRIGDPRAWRGELPENDTP